MTPEQALRNWLQSNNPDFLYAVNAYANMYGLSLTNAIRFVIGSTGDGMPQETKNVILGLVEKVEAGQQPFGGSTSPNVGILALAAVAAALVLMK